MSLRIAVIADTHLSSVPDTAQEAALAFALNKLQSKATEIAAAEAPQTNIMSEMDAMKLLKEYRFTVKALRKYAQIQNAIEKRNGKHFYSLDLVERLASNYFTKQEAMRLIDCKKSAMHEWIQNQGIEIVVVGKTSLVPKDDVMRRVRR